ncbi:TPA: hypothetical protein ACXLVG_003721, partial [Legionella anisa]
FIHFQAKKPILTSWSTIIYNPSCYCLLSTSIPTPRGQAAGHRNRTGLVFQRCVEDSDAC